MFHMPNNKQGIMATITKKHRALQINAVTNVRT